MLVHGYWRTALPALLLAAASCASAASSSLATGSGVSAQAAPEGQASVQDYAHSLSAYQDYMLQCAGCHRFDGTGASQRGVPSFRNSIGLLAGAPEGRDYMIRVPGAAQSQLDDAELADVLNWAVLTFSPEQISAGFTPFTANEVNAARPHRFDDVAAVRKRLAKQLAEKGQTLAPYLYGVNPSQ